MNSNNHLNESSAHRKEKKREINMLRLVMLCVILLGVIFVVANRDIALSRLEGMLRKNITEAGFPVRLPGSSGYAINSFDNGFMLLSETYIYVHDADGSQRYNRRHSYSEPNAAIAATRILVYDKNGRQFSFFGRNGIIYEKNSDERILYGAIGDNDSVAIVYRSDIYANILEVYDENGDWRYRARILDENIMQIAFTSSDKEILITTMNFDAGDTIASIQKYDTAEEDDGLIWATVLPGNAIPFALHAGKSNTFVLCDNSLFILNSNSGEILNRYDYKGSVIDYAFSDNYGTILINDYTAGTVNLVSVSRNEAETTLVSSCASQTEIHKGKVYVLESSAIAVYDIGDLNPETELEKIPLKEEFSRFIHVANKILLLGYNNVNELIFE